MFDYISGDVVEITPSYVVIDVNGIGFFINISLTTYEQIGTSKTAKMFIHQVLREDTNDLFGFASKEEREIFRLLISVSGIGANTARLMLSSLKPAEIVNAIMDSDVNTIKSVKGIGLKTAQRVIVDLKDKVTKVKSGDDVIFAEDNSAVNLEEALSALVMLGFNKKQAQNKLQQILKKDKSLSVEDLVKAGIKSLSK